MASNNEKMIEFNVEELMDYIHCPLYYAFAHVYEVPVGHQPSIQEQAMGVLKDTYIGIHLTSMKGPLNWGSVLRRWEQALSKLMTDGALGALTAMRNLGARILRGAFEEIESGVQTLDVHRPCRRSYDGFSMVGQIDLIKFREKTPNRIKGREIRLITVDTKLSAISPLSVRKSRLDYLMSKYGLEVTVRDQLQKYAEKVEPAVYLLRADEYVNLDLEMRDMRQVDSWISWLYQSITQGLFYPRCGAWCSSCAYLKACDVKFVSIKSLSRSAGTRYKIQERLCSSKPT